MIRVAFVQQSDVYGAAEDYLALLLEGLDRKRFEAALFLPDRPSITPLADRATPFAEVHRYAIGGAAGIKRLAGQIRAWTPDVAHVNEPAPACLAAARRAGCRVLVLTHHTPALPVHWNTRARLLWRWASRPPVHFIALSEANRDLLATRHGFPRERVSVIPHGLPLERFASAPSREDARRRLGLPPDARVVVQVARLAPQKRHDLLIQAVRLLPAALRRDLHVLVVGDGPSRASVEASVAAAGLAGVVRVTAFVEDVRPYLAAADVFALPSDFEGLPFALLEAMAMGLPAVATAVEGSRELVCDGVTGRLAPRGDAPAFAAALADVLEDPARGRRMGDAARAAFRKEHRSELMVDRTQACYERLLEAAS
jgi:glycosyltransferase involved in cell wall biosynthesis